MPLRYVVISDGTLVCEQVALEKYFVLNICNISSFSDLHHGEELQ